MNFMLSKVFVNIKTVLQSYCTQCLYWLNFFFWVYFCPQNDVWIYTSSAYTQVHFRFDLILEANSMNPDQTAPLGAVWSGTIMFAI